MESRGDRRNGNGNWRRHRRRRHRRHNRM
jgi:hypothetical protein